MLKNKKALIPMLIAAAALAGLVYLSVILNKAAYDGTDVQGHVSDASRLAATANSGIDISVAESDADYFERFRDERESVRALEIEYIDEVIAASGSDDETLAEATGMKLSIVESMETEFAMESQIRAKGFSDAAVTLKNGSVNIVVDCESLSSEQVAQILEIAMRESGQSAQNIKISASKQ